MRRHRRIATPSRLLVDPAAAVPFCAALATVALVI